MALAQVFKALGDPVRLEIVKRLSDGSPYTIGKLSKDLGVTRQGARKQLQVLVSADVVRLNSAGRETNVMLNTASLDTAKAFIAELETQWDQRLQALKEFTEK